MLAIIYNLITIQTSYTSFDEGSWS